MILMSLTLTTTMMATDGGFTIFKDNSVREQSSIHRSLLSVGAQPKRILFSFFSSFRLYINVAHRLHRAQRD